VADFDAFNQQPLEIRAPLSDLITLLDGASR